MVLLPVVLERVLRFASRHHALLNVARTDVVVLHHLLRGDILWVPSARFPYLTYHYRFLHWDIYMLEGFAVLTVGTMTVGASTLGRWVYIYGPHHDPIVARVTYRVLVCEPL